MEWCMVLPDDEETKGPVRLGVVGVVQGDRLVARRAPPDGAVADLGRGIGAEGHQIDAAGSADPRIADLLAISRREPLLRIRQVIYSAKGKAIMYVLGFYRSDRHNLVIRRFR